MGDLTIAWIPEPTGAPRVAYAIRRAVGTAVARNRLRRRLRALVAANASALPPGAYLLGAGPETRDAGPAELADLVERALQAVRATPRPDTEHAS